MIKYAFILFCICCNVAIAQVPIAYYPFDNSTNDFSGNNNNGIARGDVIPVKDRFNKPCSAMHFDGITSFIEIPNSPSLESITNAFTFTVWYKLDNYSNNQWLSVLCKGKSPIESINNPQYRFQIQQSPFSNSTSCGVGVPNQFGFSTISFNTDFTKCDFNFRDHPFEINKWCFYALTFDGNTLKAFMNGNIIYQLNYNGTINVNKESLYIGFDEPGNSEFFEGSLDDLRIFNTGLSDNEVLKLYQQNRPVNEFYELPFQNNLNYSVSSNACKVKVDYTFPIVSDPCNSSKVNLITGMPSGSLFSVGTHNISYEVVENAGSLQRNTFSINVVDLIPPKFIFTPSDTTVYYSDPQIDVPYSYKEPIATDNCEIKSITRNTGPSSGSNLKEGLHEIIYTALDKSNNSSSVSFKVNVLKKIPKDTIKVKVTDTVQPVVKKNEIKLQKQDSLAGRKNIIQKIINISSKKIVASVYDNGMVDGDTVSVFFNGNIIVDRKLITDKFLDFELELKDDQDNTLIMFAHNLGSIPPNTGVLIFFDGKKKYETYFKSDTETNATIILRRSSLPNK